MLPADRAVAEENREALAGATTASKADDIVEEKTAVIKEAQDVRREAKVQRDVLHKVERRRYKKPIYRGALEGMNAGMNPDQYGE